MDTRVFHSPIREYILIPVLFASLAADFLFPAVRPFALAVAAIGSLPTMWNAIRMLKRRVIGIDAFNTFALAASFATLEARSAVFIVLMLAFARLLDWVTETRTSNAIESLLRLKPATATVERDGEVKEIEADKIKKGDVLLVANGVRVPVDGVIIHGEADLNEAPVTGESRLQRKTVGDLVWSATLNESGTFKMRATRVGKDSTIERMVTLMRDAQSHKSKSEKMADRFAEYFLPVVAIGGFLTYLVTRNLTMTAALFLVACADDMAVAIPLAMTAALGRAAKQGVIIKGGEWLDALSRVKTIVFDKTGTLTYGNLRVSTVEFEPGADEPDFWRLLTSAEKYSEHPVGRAVFTYAAKKAADIPDPDDLLVSKGSGVWAKLGADEITLGSEQIFAERKVALTPDMRKKLEMARGAFGRTAFLVAVNGRHAATVSVNDEPRKEAHESIADLRRTGIDRIFMFTGDGKNIADRVGAQLGIANVRASMTPEQKLRELEILQRGGPVAMVGDGINDAPALARSDVGIAMGAGGTATAVEAANIVILSDDLSRLPDMVRLSKRTVSVIRGDAVIWVVSNLVGFTLVLTGIAGPAFAAFYNFATDFIPLLNSSRLFAAAREEK